jgi:hypothetical protein
MQVRSFAGLDRRSDSLDLSASRSTLSVNTDYFQEGAFSPRDGLARSTFSGSTFGSPSDLLRSLIPVDRPDKLHMLAVTEAGALKRATAIDTEFDEGDF